MTNKKDIEFESDNVKAYVQQIQAENGILAQQLDQLKAENDNIKETFDGLFKVQYKLADNNKKLRQCLTEIKEIAKIRKDDINDWLAKEILQKISEVEEQC